VVSDRALVAKEIADAGFGLSIDTGNIELFAAALAGLAGDDARVAAMSAAGHDRYSELCHSEADWADLVLDQYRSTLAAAHG